VNNGIRIKEIILKRQAALKPGNVEKMMNNNILFYLIGFFAGIYYFIKGLLWFMEKRLIEDIPTSTVRSIAMGLVEVNGQAFPFKQNILRGPFIKKDCVHYKCTVEKLVSSGKSSHWELINTEEKGDYFYLQDDTGKVLVKVSGAEYKVPADFELLTGGILHEGLPDSLKEYLEADGIKTKDILGFSFSFRFMEYDIEVGDKLYLLGTAGKNPFDDPYLFEADVEHVMIQKGDNNDKFIISEKSEKEILTELTTNSLLGIFGGGALTIVCLFFLLMFFELL
jgi:hypothetical protein